MCESFRSADAHKAVGAPRARESESEHVLAQESVWERRSEKQMAAFRMKGGRKGGGRGMMSKSTVCAACVFIYFSTTHPERQ